MCHVCIAQYEKNQNKSNFEVHQTLFNVAKMKQIENVMQKILYVEVFHTSNSTKWNVFRFRCIQNLISLISSEYWNSFFFWNRIQNKCENDSFNVFVILQWIIIKKFTLWNLRYVFVKRVKILHCLLSKFIKSSKN